MRFLLRSCVALLTMMLFALAAWGGEASRPVRIGVLAWQGLEEAEIRWSSLMSELQDRLPGRSLALRHFDLAGMAAALRAYSHDKNRAEIKEAVEEVGNREGAYQLQPIDAAGKPIGDPPSMVFVGISREPAALSVGLEPRSDAVTALASPADRAADPESVVAEPVALD